MSSQVSMEGAESQGQKLCRSQGEHDHQHPLQIWSRRLMQKDPEGVESNGKGASLREEGPNQELSFMWEEESNGYVVTRGGIMGRTVLGIH